MCDVLTVVRVDLTVHLLTCRKPHGEESAGGGGSCVPLMNILARPCKRRSNKRT